MPGAVLPPPPAWLLLLCQGFVESSPNLPAAAPPETSATQLCIFSVLTKSLNTCMFSYEYQPRAGVGVGGREPPRGRIAPRTAAWHICHDRAPRSRGIRWAPLHPLQAFAPTPLQDLSRASSLSLRGAVSSLLAGGGPAPSILCCITLFISFLQLIVVDHDFHFFSVGCFSHQTVSSLRAGTLLALFRILS